MLNCSSEVTLNLKYIGSYTEIDPRLKMGLTKPSFDNYATV